jgi:hypothetical protein
MSVVTLRSSLQWRFSCAKLKIEDKSLKEAVERADKGLVDADLGGGVIKKAAKELL